MSITDTFYASSVSGDFTDGNKALGSTTGDYAYVSITAWYTQKQMTLGFDFSSLPDNAVISSIEVGLNHYENDPFVADVTISCSNTNIGTISTTAVSTATTASKSANVNYTKTNLSGITVTFTVKSHMLNRTWYCDFAYVKVTYELHPNMALGSNLVKAVCLGTNDVSKLVDLGSIQV